jgi:hypothetical protein
MPYTTFDNISCDSDITLAIDGTSNLITMEISFSYFVRLSHLEMKGR